MKRHKVLDPGATYTFSKYFELPYAPQDILADLDCTLVRTSETVLPYSSVTLDWLADLAASLTRRLQRVSVTSEQARREALIFPVIDALCDRFDYPINIEYALQVSPWLRGSLDYYIPSAQGLLVIEAKQSDLAKGFTQLAVELIALDQWIESEQTILKGAISTGNIWQFGHFDRTARVMTQDL
ncbi:MAG: hypothetical protein AAFZ80_10560, partial [Cyanobacteria bacterium P01_A01_bin.105]